jgi:CheY-like chemotaxis protein
MNTLTTSAPRWFVVDDESMILSLVEQVLRRFSSADELLVTDLNMPGMSGIELARRIRTLAPRAKILLTTGSALTMPDERTLRSYGVDFFLPKPFGAQELMSAVRKLCGEGSLRMV